MNHPPSPHAEGLDPTRDPRAAAVYARLTAPDPPVRRAATAADSEVALSGSWRVALPPNAPPVLTVAAADLHDCLAALQVAGDGDHAIEVRCAPLPGVVSPRAHELVVDDDGVEVIGTTPLGAAAGLYHLQRLLRLRRAPLLPRGRLEGVPRLEPALTCLPFKRAAMDDLDYPAAYAGDYLVRLARAGYTGFHLNLAWDAFYDSAILPELNDKNAAERLATLREIVAVAATFGLDVYLTPYTRTFAGDHPVFAAHPEARGASLVRSDGLHCLCSSAEIVHAFFAEQTDRLFAAVPDLAGLILIVGCEGFLHCFTAPGNRHTNHTDCPNCTAPQPERIVADLVASVAAAAPRRADIVAWTYGAFTWTRHDSAEEFIRRLPERVILMSNFDTGDYGERHGVEFCHFDYSLSAVGPSETFRGEVAAARSQHRETWAKTESGCPLEMYTVPEIPALTRWAEKYRRLPPSGALGALLAWQFVGYTESLAGELAGWMSWQLDRTPTQLLIALASRDFGAANAPAAIAAWERFDAAMNCHPFSIGTAGYFKGPFYIGFAQPLVLDPASPGKLDDAFWLGHRDIFGRGQTRTLFAVDLSWTRPFGVEACRASLADMETRWRAGCAILADCIPPEGDSWAADRLDRHQALALGILCMIRSAVNMVDFFLVRDDLYRYPATIDSTRESLTVLRDIARRELANAEDGLACMARNPMLGYDYIYHYGFTEAMVRSKIAHTRELIEDELPLRQFQATFSQHYPDEWIYDDPTRRLR